MSEPTFPTVPFTTPQALGSGLNRSQVRDALADGRLRHVLREVYVDGTVSLTPADRVRAAALVTSPHLVVCDRTASWIHGVEAWRTFELDVPPLLELCALRGHEPSERPELRCLTRDLAPRDIQLIGGVRVTTPLRTALDLGCSLPRRDAFATMNALAGRHGFGPSDVVDSLVRYRRRRGVVQLRQLAFLVEPRVESRRESWVLLEIADLGLPLPEPQVWVEDDGVRRFRLDLAYRHARVAIEYDGLEHHSSEEDRAHDRARRRWLREHGWRVIVVTGEAFLRDATPDWILELREALRIYS